MTNKKRLNIAVGFFSGLGDLCAAMPTIDALCAGNNVYVILEQALYEQAREFLDAKFPAARWITYGGALSRALGILGYRKFKLDQLIILPHPPLSDVSRFIAPFTFLIRIISPGTVIWGPTEDPGSYLFTRRYIAKRELPLMQRIGEALRSCGLAAKAQNESLPEPAAIRTFRYDIYVHYGASRANKLVPLKVFHGLIEKLSKDYRIIVSAPKNMVGAMKSLEQKGIEVWSGSIAQNAALIKQCKIALTHDTGMGHLASLLGIPVIALFGPTEPALYAPHGDVMVVRASTASDDPLPCMPCGARECQRSDSRFCMAEIAPSDLIDTARYLITKGENLLGIAMNAE